MEKKQNELLGDRLLCVSEMIRLRAVLCDVGTDHAKLPIYLVKENKIERAYATDINKGPIASAVKNISEFNLSDKIQCILTDGLELTDGLDVTDISICGMGGELIASILSRCTYIKDENINLVLQPMTHTQDLRKFLWDSGFVIDDERLVKESGKLYVIIKAHYCGIVQNYSDVDLLLGKSLGQNTHGELYREMITRELYHLANRQKSSDPHEAQYAKNLYDKIYEVIK